MERCVPDPVHLYAEMPNDSVPLGLYQNFLQPRAKVCQQIDTPYSEISQDKSSVTQPHSRSNWTNLGLYFRPNRSIEAPSYVLLDPVHGNAHLTAWHGMRLLASQLTILYNFVKGFPERTPSIRLVHMRLFQHWTSFKRIAHVKLSQELDGTIRSNNGNKCSRRHR